MARGIPDRPWPARSPDLTVMDFWLWGYLKDVVYQNQHPLPNPAALRQRIDHCIRSLTQQQLRSAVHHTIHRMQACIDNGGNHFEHLIE